MASATSICVLPSKKRREMISYSLAFNRFIASLRERRSTQVSSIGNCDTTIFLGGSDSDTLKIIVERMGKETVKTLSFGNSG